MMNPDWTLLVAAVIFLLTLWALNSLLFKPLLAVIDERARLTEGAREEAARTRQEQANLLNRYDEQVKEAKLKGYQLAESARRQSLEERQRRLVLARETADRQLTAARSGLEQDIEEARVQLTADAREAARLLASRLLQKT